MVYRLVYREYLSTYEVIFLILILALLTCLTTDTLLVTSLLLTLSKLTNTCLSINTNTLLIQ